MTCTGCGKSNRADAKFCKGCGKALVPRCGSCGREIDPDARFCDGCGAAQTAPTPGDDAGARKVVTIVFADLVGSTALHERVDPESARAFMNRYYEAMRAAVEGERGAVTQFLGDGVKAVFGAPRVAEDDAIRAVRAAVAMQRAFRALAEQQKDVVGKTGLRVAVNTGEVVASDETEIIGDPVNVAARLQEEARDGDVVIGESTRRLVSELVTLAPLGTFKVKGRAEAVGAYRVVSLDRPAGAPATPFVGREEELRRLAAVYDGAVGARRARLAVILGSPGLGKSRLVGEIARRVGEGATVFIARCGAGSTTFAPIAEALRVHLQPQDAPGTDTPAPAAVIEGSIPVDAPDRARVAAGIAALLARSPASPEETFFVIRRFLAAVAAGGPVLLVIDDLQWAEPLLLDLVEHLVTWSTDTPLFILAAARPELRDTRSALATAGGLVSEVVTLGGLDAGAATRLAASVIGAGELPAAVAGRVLAASEGNPLFVGELVRMLVQDGALKREGDRWTTAVELASLEMPPTIQALLAARIERLGTEERMIVERAAVVGRQFSRASVAYLLSREVSDLDARLESLRRSELIEPDTGWFLGEPALRFHHVLIRDAAYRRILKGTRAELHARLADWIEEKIGEAAEQDETIGWHLEQAHAHLRELGPLDERGRALGERAARRLAAAGRRALGRDDVPLAASLLGRAVDCLDREDATRADLALDWSEALLAAGEVTTAVTAIEELGRFIGASERLRAWHTCFSGQLSVLTDPKAVRATAESVAAAAEALGAAGDQAGEAKGHYVHAMALRRLGRIGACEVALDRALAAARKADDRRRANAVLSGAPLAALWGPGPVTRASGRCLDVVRVLRITHGAPAVEAVALRCQAVLEALRGRGEAARRMIASSRRLVEELGITHRILEADVFAGLIDLYEGDPAAAERSLQGAYEGLRDHGLGIEAAQAAAFLGRALLAEGRAAEAETLSEESEALAGDDLKAASAWRGVRAEALARRGEHAAAIALARAAVDIAAATDALLDHADARIALATALRAAGQSGEADAEEARAIELWEAKGATLLVERARRSPPHPFSLPTEERGAGVSSRLSTLGRDRHEVSGEGEAPRRVRSNAATAHVARLEAAVAARDLDAISALLGPELQVVNNHLDGSVEDRASTLAAWRALIAAPDPAIRAAALATLGDSLALCRRAISASGFTGRNFDVGSYESAAVDLFEVDPDGRQRRVESFKSDHLGGAVVRLYERYAELQPEGPERERAAAVSRSVGAWVGEVDLDRFAATLSPTVECIDHRTLGTWSAQGSEALLRELRSMFELTDAAVIRHDEILALEPGALLMRGTQSGTGREGAGAYERVALRLWLFGSDGRLQRIEWFDPDAREQAVARFDELTGGPRVSPRARRVRPNAALANVRAVEAAVAARDADALTALNAEDTVMVDHSVGVELDRAQTLRVFLSFLSAEDFTIAYEPLATLGASLALCRQSASAAGVRRGAIDVGPYEREGLTLVDLDSDGQRRRTEYFAADRLGDAVARLYERYAEILPEGSDRARAAATARSVAAMLGSFGPDRWAAACSPEVEGIDHRVLGTFSHRGAALLRNIQSWAEVADDASISTEDVLSLEADALIARWTFRGTDRASGGIFERPYVVLLQFGSDGLLVRIEWFDVGRDAEALARYDELAGARSPRAARRVRPNAATANAARLDAAIAASDSEALRRLWAEESRVVDHTTGATFDRDGVLFSYRPLMKARNPVHRYVPVATLGRSFALCHLFMSAGGRAGATFDVGAYEIEQIHLIEVDTQGRSLCHEQFFASHLDEAVLRLYERYADSLRGSDRDRALATARGIRAHQKLEPDRFDRVAADAEFVDHRLLGFGSFRGAEHMRRGANAILELADDVSLRIEDVLDLRPDGFVVRTLVSGRDRTSQGSFEQVKVEIRCFGSDGRMTRVEWFDPDHGAEALARFDEVATAASPARRVRPNAATANAARLDAAVAARDADALPALFAEGMRGVNHHLDRGEFDRNGALFTWRALVGASEPRSLHEPLATLGDSLALFRQTHSASGFSGRTLDVGPYEIDAIGLIDVDPEGRQRQAEFFGVNQLGDAVVRLYERYAEILPDGPAKERAVATARIVAAIPFTGPIDPDRYVGTFAPEIEAVDHRTVGVGSLSGIEAVGRAVRTFIGLTRDFTARIDAVLALRSDALLTRGGNFGTDRETGGEFDRDLCHLWIFGPDGRIVRWEQFDGEQEALALARFDELTHGIPSPPRGDGQGEGETTEPPFANAAWRSHDTFRRLWEERAWDQILASYAPSCRLEDRRRIVGIDLQGEDFLTNLKLMYAMPGGEWRMELLATRGDRLALQRVRFSAGRDERSRVEFEHLSLVEVDAEGRRTVLIIFDPDDLDAAYAELDRRFVAAEGTFWRPQVSQAIAARDWTAMAKCFAPDFILTDHRPLGWGTLRGPDAYPALARSLVEMRPDARFRVEHVRTDGLRSLVFARWTGQDLDGAFEISGITVTRYDADGLVKRWELYDLDQLDAARACYESFAAEPPRDPLQIPPNAASRVLDRSIERREAGDWEAADALYAPDCRYEDRRRGVRLEGDRDMLLASHRFTVRSRREAILLATHGDRLALHRLRFTGQVEAPIEIELLQLLEVDTRNRIAAVVVFDPDDRRSAAVEMLARYLRSQEGRLLRAAFGEFMPAVQAHDLGAIRTVLPAKFYVLDRRRTGVGRLESADDYLESLAAMFELSPDATFENLYQVAAAGHGDLAVGRTFGTLREGGEWESVYVRLMRHEDGQAVGLELFELEDLDRARARFEELRAGRGVKETKRPLLESAVTRLADRHARAWEERDWETVVACHGPAHRAEDRRAHMLLELSAEQNFRDLRFDFDASSRWQEETLATRGERLALHRVKLAGDRHGDVGPWETEWLAVLEADPEGQSFRSILVFDPDAFDAVLAELDERYERGEAAPCPNVSATMRSFLAAFARRDWEALGALFVPDVVVEDHRLLGWERLAGRAAYVEALRSLVDLAPDARLRLDHVRMSPHGLFWVAAWEGARDGGAFEAPWIIVSEHDVSGLVVRFDQYDLDRLDAALARFAELRPDPLRLPSNLATRTVDRWRGALEAEDWEAVRATCSPALLFDDRRPAILLTGGLDMFVANTRYLGKGGRTRVEVSPLATAGDRLLLLRSRWTTHDGSVLLSEMEALEVVEVDAEGRAVAVIILDADDRGAASRELGERFSRGEEARSIPAAFFACGRALNAHDTAAARAALPDEFVFHDRRRTGIGRIEGADAYVASVAALFELAPGASLGMMYYVAIEPHGFVAMSRWSGTLREGGEFESPFAVLALFVENQFVALELYEPEDLETARARLEAWRRESAPAA